MISAPEEPDPTGRSGAQMVPQGWPEVRCPAFLVPDQPLAATCLAEVAWEGEPFSGEGDDQRMGMQAQRRFGQGAASIHNSETVTQHLRT